MMQLYQSDCHRTWRPRLTNYSGVGNLFFTPDSAGGDGDLEGTRVVFF
jgi:hypothetical protein